MKRFNLMLSLAIVLASAVLCGRFLLHSFASQQDKADLAVLNHVRYGLFSVAEWKKQITGILSEEINKLSLTKGAEQELRKRLEGLLNTLIDKVYEQIRKGNSRTAEGRLKQSFINVLVDMKEVKKGIPGYAGAIMQELTKAKTQQQVRALLNRELEHYIDETFEVQDTSRIASVLERNGVPDVGSARAKLDAGIRGRRALLRNEAVLLAILPIGLFAWSSLGRQPLTAARHGLLILALVILLVAGVTTPMIDMEAKITRMGFVLMGHPVQFENQVLYFQSKSILDVFWIMVRHKDIQMKFVGVLLITFSILFPLLKLASLPAYRYDYRNARKNPVVAFFVLRSGKWSMADVTVVAIFMAYIGFNGIISSQFRQLTAAAPGLDIMTTNGTSLQPGYYLFLTYILLSMVSAGFLAGNENKKEE